MRDGVLKGLALPASRVGLLLLGFFALAMASSGMSGYWLLTLTSGATFSLTLLSITIVSGYVGQISLAPAAFMGIGAYVTAFAAETWGMPFVLATGVSMTAAALLGLLIAVPALRVRGLFLALATIALSSTIDQTLFTSAWLTGFPVGRSVPRPTIAGLDLTNDHALFVTVLAVVIMVAVGVRWVRCGTLGRRWTAIRDDETAAAACGIDVASGKIVAFLMAATVAALGGALHAGLNQYVNGGVTYSTIVSLALVVLITLLGVRSVGAAVAGGIVFAGVPVLLDDWLGGSARALQWAAVVSSFALIATIVNHPQGLVHWMADAVRDRRRRRRPLPRLSDSDIDREAPHVRTEGRASAVSTRPVLEASCVSKRFGGVQALDEVDLTVMPSEVVALIGPNGAGKSTLFNIINGLARADGGTVTVNGRDLQGVPAHRRAAAGIARTFQVPRLWPSMTVREHLRTAGLATRRPPTLDDPSLEPDAVLDLVGLAQYADWPASDLSLGVHRRVELARALVVRPRVLLMDEPSSGLDASGAKALVALIRQIRHQFAVGILVVEHDMTFVADVADRAVALHLGRMVAAGPVHEVYGDPTVVEAYLGGMARPTSGSSSQS